MIQLAEIISDDKIAGLKPIRRIHLNDDLLDIELGGGVPVGTVTLITAVPGGGKSTLLARAIPRGSTYYSNEEKGQGFQQKFSDAHIEPHGITYVFGQTLSKAFTVAESLGSPVLVVDSLQECEYEPLTIVQMCKAFAKRTEIPVLLVSHVNKKGIMVGFEKIRHRIDAHIHLLGWDELESKKNRYPGPIPPVRETIKCVTKTSIGQHIFNTSGRLLIAMWFLIGISVMLIVGGILK